MYCGNVILNNNTTVLFVL